MSLLTSERSAQHRGDWKTGEFLISRPLELARAVLPHLVEHDELEEIGFIEAEDTLSKLNAQAEQLLADHVRVPRRTRKELSRYAHRLLEITESEPDLHESRSFDLIGHASDVTGERELLVTAAAQAKRTNNSSYDTNLNLQAIQAALELDKPFTEVVRNLNAAIPTIENSAYDEPHTSLEPGYDYLFDSSLPSKVNRSYDKHSERPLFK